MIEDSPIAQARALPLQIQKRWVPPADKGPVRTKCRCRHQLGRHVIPHSWFDGCKAELATIPSRRTLACDVPGCGCREFH